MGRIADFTYRTISTPLISFFFLLLLEVFAMRGCASFVGSRIRLPSTYRIPFKKQPSSFAIDGSYSRPFAQVPIARTRRILTAVDVSKGDKNQRLLTRTSLRKMRVAELRDELEQRAMNTSGTRDVLLDRMFKVIDNSEDAKKDSEKLRDGDHDSVSKPTLDPCIDPKHTFVLQISGVINNERGTAASGIVLFDNEEQHEIWSAQQFARKEVTVTEITYYGLMTCLRFAKKHMIRKVIIEICDGNVVNQISGRDPVKDERLKQLHWVVMKLLEDVDSYELYETETVSKANRLATTALDTERSKGLEFLRDETSSKKPPQTETHTTPSKSPKTGTYLLRVDGGARGNPGKAGAGMVIYDPQGKEIWCGWKYLGETTNNIAEYSAVLVGLQQAHLEGIVDLRVESDSQLVVKQLNGEYKVKNDVLKLFHAENLEAIQNFESVEIHHILREENKRADELANCAMDTMGSHSSDSEINEEQLDIPSINSSKSLPVRTAPKTKSAPLVSASLAPEGTYLLQVDGGARGNPGVAGAGMVIYDSRGNEIWSGYKFLGTATNNVAEYTAMLLGLKHAQSLGISTLKVECDSQLVVRQIEGVYRVKNLGLKKIYSEVMKEKESFSRFDVQHIMRSDNARADELANKAMDTRDSYGL